MYSGCSSVVVRRYIDFFILLIPTPLVSALLQQHPYFFVHLKKNFLFLFQCFLVMKYYELKFFHTVLTHIRANTGVPRQPHEGCT